MMTDERDVERYFTECVTRKGWLSLKFIPDNRKGMPDRMVCVSGGQVVWVELKRPDGGKLSTVQRLRHSQLRKLGFRVEVIRSKAEVDDLMRSLGDDT